MIIVNESLRAISLRENHLSKSIESKTLKYLSENYSDNFFYFNKAFANSTFTNTSLITILSGWNTSQNIGIAYKNETFFDKAKLFKQSKNFFFSSQDLNHSGLKFFFDSKSIDHIYHYENGNKDFSEIFIFNFVITKRIQNLVERSLIANLTRHYFVGQNTK